MKLHWDIRNYCILFPTVLIVRYIQYYFLRHRCVDLVDVYRFYNTTQGRIQDFNLGGRQKILWAQAHYERGTKLTFGMGPGARFKDPGSSRVVLMLSRAIWAFFLKGKFSSGTEF